MHKPLSIVLFASLLVACSRSTPVAEDEGRLYSYVDAQGNLVTMERRPEERKQGVESGQQEAGDEDRRSAEPLSEGELAGEDAVADPQSDRYQTTEEVQQELDRQLEEEERDRFVTFRGPEGEIITRPLDLVAEREARENRPAPYEELDPSDQYIETVSRVPADCCNQNLGEAAALEAGTETRLRFATGAIDWIRLKQPRPAVIRALDPEVGALVMRSFVHKDAFVAPRVLLLNRQGTPVLKVDNLFTRRYPESWHRFGYFQGELPLAPEHAYVVFYLPYGGQGESGVIADGSLDGVLEEGARYALEGEFVVRTRAGPRQSADPAP